MEKIFDLIIIGGGPAGITAAIYASRKKLNYAIVYKDIGGELAKTTFVENYTGYKNVSGEELTRIFEEHMKMFNPIIIEDHVSDIEKHGKYFLVKTHDKTLETKTILICTGANPRGKAICIQRRLMVRNMRCAIIPRKACRCRRRRKYWADICPAITRYCR
jgi:alkyl hydroperoxide reductase subunit F